MKMAKASEADINMAMTLSNYCDSISRGHMPDALSNHKEHIEWLDSDDSEQYARLLHGLQELLDQGSISRVVWGMAVVLSPANKLIDPAADTLEHHPSRAEAETHRDELLDALERLKRSYEWTKPCKYPKCDSEKNADAVIAKVRKALGKCYYAPDGTLLNPDGTRSIFDDVDQ